MARKLALMVALVAVSSLVWGGAAFGGAPGDLPLTSSPSEGPVGTVIDVSGDGCVLADPPGPLQVFIFYTVEPHVGTQAVVTPNPDGTWAGQITVPDTVGPDDQPVLPGDDEVLAVCTSELGVGDVAVYGPNPFTVTAVPEPPAPEPAPEAAEAPAPAPVQAAPTFTG